MWGWGLWCRFMIGVFILGFLRMVVADVCLRVGYGFVLGGLYGLFNSLSMVVACCCGYVVHGNGVVLGGRV